MTTADWKPAVQAVSDAVFKQKFKWLKHIPTPVAHTHTQIDIYSHINTNNLAKLVQGQ